MIARVVESRRTGRKNYEWVKKAEGLTESKILKIAAEADVS